MSSLLSGAQIVVRLLERQGVRLVTGYPGGAFLPVYDASGIAPPLPSVSGSAGQASTLVSQYSQKVS